MGAVMLLATLLLALVTPLLKNVPMTAIFPQVWPVVVMNFVVGLGLGTGIVVCEYLPPVSGQRGSRHNTTSPARLRKS